MLKMHRGYRPVHHEIFAMLKQNNATHAKHYKKARKTKEHFPGPKGVHVLTEKQKNKKSRKKEGHFPSPKGVHVLTKKQEINRNENIKRVRDQA